MSEGIVWGDPPENRRAPASQWVPKIMQLKERPGFWGKLAEGKPSTIYTTAANLRHRRIDYPEGNFEFVGRKIDDETAGIWGRYLEEGE